MRIPIAREGYPFILVFLLITIIIFNLTEIWPIRAAFVLWEIFVIAFFRDPERVIPSGNESIVSPADGLIIKIEQVWESRLLEADALKISIFMNVFNVHVNRAPAACKVVKILYNPGKFVSANLDKASLENEQNAVLGESQLGHKFVFNQIAGLIARRIVCRVKEGARLTKGERFGMIRFGSRVDVYLPPGSRVSVKLGDKVRAGSSIIAYWH
ncbi:MAG: phosphatidylserine decarboxylase family protein [Deltaproteobacteria bacterium]|nr:phosphatidylserine decarboxylase family protein [Deltaproteobacteria bacterium]